MDAESSITCFFWSSLNFGYIILRHTKSDALEPTVHTYHPGLAENIAPDGGPGSDITVVRLQLPPSVNPSWSIGQLAP